jgi:PAS domain-containing protein
MDINLAGVMNGVTAVRFIFQLYQFPIVFLTAFCNKQLFERANNVQPLEYILKPFTDRNLSSNFELALYNHTNRKKYLEMYPVGEPKKIMAARDPILITDTREKIIFYNPYAIPLLDLPEEEILMDYWREVMMIINDQTNEEVEDPVPEVVRQMLVVTHEFNTAVLTKSGKDRKVSGIVRPVKDGQHDPIGVFINIREKTLDQIKMAKKT